VAFLFAYNLHTKIVSIGKYWTVESHYFTCSKLLVAQWPDGTLFIKDRVGVTPLTAIFPFF